MSEKFYNSQGDPDMFRRNIPHISHAINNGLAKQIGRTQIEIIENIILVLEDGSEIEKVQGEILDLIPLEQLKDNTYE